MPGMATIWLTLCVIYVLLLRVRQLTAIQVKSRFGRHRRDIRDHAKSEGRGMYQLNLGTGIAEKATALLLDDNFVYGVDIRVRAVQFSSLLHTDIQNC